jgi:putative heme iron utilization protein
LLIESLLYEILSDLVHIKDVLLIVKNTSATSEIKTNNLTIRQNEKWITIGSNDDPAHLHINSEMIKSIKFIEEKKPERTSFSVRFYDQKQERVIAAFFTKMYDTNKNLDISRKNLYDDLQKKFGSVIQI